MAVHYLDDGNDDGTVLGQSASAKVGFYGATAIVQPSLTPTTTATATTAVNERRIDSIQTLLVNLGLCTTS